MHNLFFFNKAKLRKALHSLTPLGLKINNVFTGAPNSLCEVHLFDFKVQSLLVDGKHSEI